MSAATLDKIVQALLPWFARNARDLPWRGTRDPYAIWVSEIMLQQTQVSTVIPYWKRWMIELPTTNALAKAKPQKVLKLWEGLGYYHRARNLLQAAQNLVARHGGAFPRDFDAMLSLPGVGRYTAGAIASIAFNQPHPILDGNVIRVLTRLFGITRNPRETKTNVRLWQLAEQLVSRASRVPRHASACSAFNQSLMELGSLVCTPRSPQCDSCPLNRLCLARRRGLQEKIPRTPKRKGASNRRFIAFIAERNGKFLVQQRPAGVVNAHLWEFPNTEVGALGSENHPDSSPGTNGTALSRERFRVVSKTPLCTIKHSITSSRITLDALRARLARSGQPSSFSEGVWLSRARLDALPFTAAHGKILRHLTSSATYRGARST